MMASVGYFMQQKFKAFTLIELLIVISLAGILAAISLPRFMGASVDARRALNNATVGALNAAVANLTPKTRIPGFLTSVAVTTVAASYPNTPLYIANIDNNPNVTTNNYVGFNASGTIITGGAQGAYANTPLTATIIGSATLSYADITGSTRSTGCTNIFTILMGNSGVTASTSTTSTYQTLVASPGTFSSINGSAVTFSSGSIISNVIATGILSGATTITPGTSGACLYKLNSNYAPTFYIIYDAKVGIFYTAEM